jgi:aldehyde dehydrogenase (NAD+)
MSTDDANLGLETERNEAPHYPMYVGGDWVDTDDRYEIRSPATERLVATVARGDLTHVDAAVAAAKAAHEEGTWRLTTPAQRAQVLRTVADRFAERIYDLAPLHAEEIGATIRLAEPFHYGTFITWPT